VLATAMATEVQPHRPKWPCYTQSQQQPQCKARPSSDAFTGRFDVGVTWVARPQAPSCTQRVHTKCPSRRLRCHAMPSTPPFRTLPRAAGCTVRVSVHTPHVARTSLITVPDTGFSRLLSSFGIPFGFGRPRKPWPACQCAWRCVCAAPTKSAHSAAGHPSRVLKRHKAKGTPRCSPTVLAGYPRGTPLPECTR
jgi:hypothetical protein